MKAFISHSSRDKQIARRVAEQIRIRGWEVWIDEGELKPGDSLARSISDSIATIDVFVLIITQNSISSRWVNHELDQVMPLLVEEGVRIVPLLFESVPIPMMLRGFLYGDCRSDDQIRRSLNLVFASLDRNIPMLPQEMRRRLDERITPNYCIRLIPEREFEASKLLGHKDRSYVATGDYFENCGRSLREIMENLLRGNYLDEALNASERWIALIFEVGELYKTEFDLMPGTWKAAFRILSDKRRLGIFTAPQKDMDEIGRPPRDYYSGNQRRWQDRVRTALGEYPDDETILEREFGIRSMCFEGNGVGANNARIFFIKNRSVQDLNHSVQSMGAPDDGIVLI